jgi:hypothetical protein
MYQMHFLPDIAAALLMLLRLPSLTVAAAAAGCR